MKCLPIVFVGFLMLASTPAADAQTLRLAWDPNPEPEVAGYVIEFGSASRQYTQSVKVGKVTQWAMKGLAIGHTYYFAVRAYTANGVMSPQSAEVAAVVPVLSTDLIWRHKTTGAIARWKMNQTNQLSGTLIEPNLTVDPKWQIAGTGDFNRDNESDIVWQHADGWISVWFMRDSAMMSGQLFDTPQVDPSWKISTVADMDNDGYADLVWRRSTDGAVAVWFMTGTRVRDGRLLEPSYVPDLNWVISGAGDMNGDGYPDLLWRHATHGSLSVWFMRGYQQLSGKSLTPDTLADFNWRIVAMADVDEDTLADIIWQHSDGRLAAWVMNGTSLVRGLALNPGRVSDVGWQIVAGR